MGFGHGVAYSPPPQAPAEEDCDAWRNKECVNDAVDVTGLRFSYSWSLDRFIQSLKQAGLYPTFPTLAGASGAADSPSEEVSECTESLDTEGNWGITFGGYKGYGGELTFGEDQGNFFVTLRIGFGWGGGASYDPNATIPGPVPINRNQSGYVLSVSGQLNFNAGPVGANLETGVARNFNNEESAFFGGPSFSFVSERWGLAASASLAGQATYYTKRNKYYDNQGTCRAGRRP